MYNEVFWNLELFTFLQNGMYLLTELKLHYINYINTGQNKELRIRTPNECDMQSSRILSVN